MFMFMFLFFFKKKLDWVIQKYINNFDVRVLDKSRVY